MTAPSTNTTAILVFARYPEPGRAKTRLIPALGPQGAIDLYRQLTELTLAQVKAWGQDQSVDVTVWFAGQAVAPMVRWLGDDLTYRQQPSGDLGDRMGTAFQAAFDQGYQQAIAIGTDCPWLDRAILAQAAQALASHDLVLGPANDGGYYLIGLRQYYPQLFQNIPWSTAEVLARTVAIAQALGLTMAYLPTLTDIDTPEDLAFWQSHRQALV